MLEVSVAIMSDCITQKTARYNSLPDELPYYFGPMCEPQKVTKCYVTGFGGFSEETWHIDRRQ